jgi:hypothetical protein
MHISIDFVPSFLYLEICSLAISLLLVSILSHMCLYV